MKAVVQRVSAASVSVDGKTVGEIGIGFLVLLGVRHGDDTACAQRIAKKLCGLRIFEDEQGKINRSLADVGGSLLIVSQFTLYADCSRGYRPGFTDAAEPGFANEMYEYFIAECEKYIPRVERGVFGADMKVSLLNDGPFTIILE